MSYITAQGANAWTDKVKLNLTSLDAELEVAVASQVLARVSPVYDTSSWTNDTNTPSLIKSIMGMMYVAWYFQRVYSEDTDISNYGLLLMERAEALLDGIATGANVLDGAVLVGGATAGTVAFYPTDLSSSLTPTSDDSSLGAAKFTMGQIW